MKQPDQNPFMPDELRALLPTQADLDDTEAEKGSKAIGALLKNTEAEATWICPDCSQSVKPRQLSLGRWLPRAFCDCPGGADRRLCSFQRWVEQDEEEHEKQRRYKLLNACELIGTGLTFSSWQTNNKARKQAIKTARIIIQKILRGHWGLWWGPFGCGKTHLAHAIATELVLEHGIPVRVINWLSQLRYIQKSWTGDSAEAPYWDSMLNVRVLFLDDFDKQLPRLNDLGKSHTKLPSSWYMESLYWIIDERYKANRPTILIANQSQDDLTRVLQAIGGTAVDAVLSRIMHRATNVDWGKIGLTDYRSETNIETSDMQYKF